MSRKKIRTSGRIFYFVSDHDFQMRMLRDPLLELDRKPEAVDTAGDQGEQEPLDVVAEQLTAGAVEHQLMAVNIGVLCHPTLLVADSPGSADAEGEADLANDNYEIVKAGTDAVMKDPNATPDQRLQAVMDEQQALDDRTAAQKALNELNNKLAATKERMIRQEKAMARGRRWGGGY